MYVVPHCYKTYGSGEKKTESASGGMVGGHEGKEKPVAGIFCRTLKRWHEMWKGGFCKADPDTQQQSTLSFFLLLLFFLSRLLLGQPSGSKR